MEKGVAQMPTKDVLEVCSKEAQLAYAQCIILYPHVVCGLPSAQAFSECMKIYEKHIQKKETPMRNLQERR